MSANRTIGIAALPALGALALALAAGLAGCGDGPEPACSSPLHMRCDGNTVVTCMDDNVTRTACSGATPECSYVDSTSGFACVAEACDYVGPQGRCLGDTVTRCTAGELTDTTCGDDQVCGWVDDVTGYGCRAAAEPAMVHGEIKYEDRPQTGRGPVGELRALPVRGVTVTVIDDATAQVLATVTTADNGGYVAYYTATAGAMVHVTAVARSTFAGRPITVTGSGGAVHGFGSASFASAPDSTVDLVITDASHESEAFNVFDIAVVSMDAITGELGVPMPVPLRLIWFRGSQDGTYFGGSAIHLLGASSDDDGYDDTVIAHEIGHFVEHTVGRSDSPGGGHNGAPTDPRLAWSEGYSTYWAQSSLGHPVYSDSNSGGGFFDNIDTELTRATGTGLTQPVSEGMVSQILWDIGDVVGADGAADDDMMTSASHPRVNAIQKAYLKTATLRTVGTGGVDLVDFLDGWFDIEGLGSCAPVRDIVVAKHNFPYDFNGPGGACP